MVTVDEVARLALRGKLREVQRICEEAGRPVPSTVVDVVAISRDVVETKRENVVMVDERSRAMTELG